MKGNLIFFAITLVFLFALALISSRAFLPAELKGPPRELKAPVSSPP
ncbi:hypothetical protein [Anthocerotibacter panamensis]|nr:hypothetical protein [Anthocerotibacter panamensis]